jgi:hypothetical protein
VTVACAKAWPATPSENTAAVAMALIMRRSSISFEPKAAVLQLERSLAIGNSDKAGAKVADYSRRWLRYQESICLRVSSLAIPYPS